MMRWLHSIMLVLLLPIMLVSCGEENSDDLIDYKVLPPTSAGPEWYSNMAKIDDDYIYGVGEKASASSSASRDMAVSNAMANLSRNAKSQVTTRVKQALVSSGDFDQGNEEIIGNFSKAALIKSSNMISAPHVHKEVTFKYKSGYKSFACYKISRKDLDKSVYEVIESKAKTESDPDKKKMLLKSLEELDTN